MLDAVHSNILTHINSGTQEYVAMSEQALARAVTSGVVLVRNRDPYYLYVQVKLKSNSGGFWNDKTPHVSMGDNGP